MYVSKKLTYLFMANSSKICLWARVFSPSSLSTFSMKSALSALQNCNSQTLPCAEKRLHHFKVDVVVEDALRASEPLLLHALLDVFLVDFVVYVFHRLVRRPFLQTTPLLQIQHFI